jgi:UDP-N-acetyl-D-glucosamine dehydrogenase
MAPKRRSSPPLRRFTEHVSGRRARIGVIGLGYVGLPLATEFAKAGFRVTGFDIDPRRVARLQTGRSYIQDVPSREVRDLVTAGRFHATTDFDELRTMDAIEICVPTPLRKTRDPDVSYIISAVQEIAPRLRRGQLIVLESTTYPGTTDELVRPILEEQGMRAGKDYFLAFSPERIDPGNPRFHTRNIPKVVGGATADCRRAVSTLYEMVFEQVVPVTSTQVAETVKLLENTFRSVNIGMVNEIALMCDKLNIDVWEVIDAAATKPFGFMPFYPGPGLGGHCIPIDPFYLSWKARQSGFEARFIELAGQVNGSMPYHVVRRVADSLNSRRRSVRGARVLLLGVAYKADIDDVRESPSLDILEILEKEGARVSYCDPYVPQLLHGGKRLRSLPFRASTLRSAECVVIATAHKAFDYQLISRHARSIVDCRNALKGRRRKGVFKL